MCHLNISNLCAYIFKFIVVLLSRNTVINLLAKYWPFRHTRTWVDLTDLPGKPRLGPSWNLSQQAPGGEGAGGAGHCGHLLSCSTYSRTQSLWKYPLSYLWPVAFICKDVSTAEIEISWRESNCGSSHSSQILGEWLNTVRSSMLCCCPICLVCEQDSKLPGLAFHNTIVLGHIHSLLRPAGEVIGTGNYENYKQFSRKSK